MIHDMGVPYENWFFLMNQNEYFDREFSGIILGKGPANEIRWESSGNTYIFCQR